MVLGFEPSKVPWLKVLCIYHMQGWRTFFIIGPQFRFKIKEGPKYELKQVLEKQLTLKRFKVQLKSLQRPFSSPKRAKNGPRASPWIPLQQTMVLA